MGLPGLPAWVQHLKKNRKCHRRSRIDGRFAETASSSMVGIPGEGEGHIGDLAWRRYRQVPVASILVFVVGY